MPGVELNLLLPLMQKSLAQGQTFFVTVRSNSMAPLLRKGDQIAVEAAILSELRHGDIVVVNEGLDLLTHRYWGKSEGEKRLVTRGDRSLAFDPPWEAERLVGRVTARRRQQHTFALRRGPGGWLTNHLGRLALLEQRLFSGSTEPAATVAVVGAANNVGNERRLLPAWLLRRAFRLWAMTITFLCTFIARATRQEQDENSG